MAELKKNRIENSFDKVENVNFCQKMKIFQILKPCYQKMLSIFQIDNTNCYLKGQTVQRLNLLA